MHHVHNAPKSEINTARNGTCDVASLQRRVYTIRIHVMYILYCWELRKFSITYLWAALSRCSLVSVCVHAITHAGALLCAFATRFNTGSIASLLRKKDEFSIQLQKEMGLKLVWKAKTWDTLANIEICIQLHFNDNDRRQPIYLTRFRQRK